MTSTAKVAPGRGKRLARGLHGPVVCAVLAAMPVAGAAQEAQAVPFSDAELIGNPQRGVDLADAMCSECHGVGPGIYTSPDDDATAFQRIAETPGMTSRALTVWLTTFHPDRTMPAFLLERSEREDIIAYILSLAEE